jgi:hypothetical protein
MILGDSFIYVDFYFFKKNVPDVKILRVLLNFYIKQNFLVFYYEVQLLTVLSNL